MGADLHRRPSGLRVTARRESACPVHNCAANSSQRTRKVKMLVNFGGAVLRRIKYRVCSFFSADPFRSVDATPIPLQSGGNAGAACVTRTRDPIITNDVLYRLS